MLAQVLSSWLSQHIVSRDVTLVLHCFIVVDNTGAERLATLGTSALEIVWGWVLLHTVRECPLLTTSTH